VAVRRAERANESELPAITAVAQASNSPVPDSSNAGRIFRFRSQDGLSLAVRMFAAGDRKRIPLLCLSGLSRNSRDFVALGQFFSSHPTEPRAVYAFDYRGRGLSDPDPDWSNYKPLVEAQDFLAALTILGIGEGVVVGTSRGGIIAMMLGALRPTLLAGVVLNDIGPVVEGTGLVRIKKYLSARHTVANLDEAVVVARRINEGQFPGLSEEDWRAFAGAYFSSTGNGLAPQFDPNLAKSIADIDLSERIPLLWPQFMSLARVPMLAIRGEFSDVLSPRTLEEMAERHPRFEHLTVSGQGHAPLLRDIATLRRIMAFARNCDSAAKA
jgi:pimeloyl-ACP methyl ester carboxylesterase